MRGKRWLADGIAALSLLLLVSAEIMGYIANPGALIGNLVLGSALVIGFGGVGWLLWRRVPHNPGHIEPDTLTRVSAMVDTYGWLVAIPLAVPVPLLLLPDGRLPSRRWRPVLWAVIGFANFSQDPGLTGLVGGAGPAICIGALPVCIAVAVLRYRLYDFGRLVSRTVSYALVTGTLVAIYFGLVTAPSSLMPKGDELGVAGATLVVAALFQPPRRRVQASVDRRFKRARYDAGRTVEAFSTRLRDDIDLDSLRADLVEVVRRTMEPASVRLWLWLWLWLWLRPSGAVSR